MAAAPPPPAIDTSPIPKGRVSITPNLLSKQQVKALLDDAKNCHQKGAFVPGGLRRRKHANAGSTTDMMKTTTDATTRICDICGIFDDAESVGPSDARDDLLDLMADLRELLQIDLGIRLSEGMELQYLRYPGGSHEQKKKASGFYGRHFDSSPEDKGTCRRKVSLLLYLNDETWDATKDGGVLRAYLPQHQQSQTSKKRKRNNSDVSHEKGGSIQDITPKGGTLVLFDSASVEHEVLPTHRERWAVVGWFLGEETTTVPKRNSSTNNRKGEKREDSTRASHHSGDDQQHQRKKKNKKKRRRKGG